MTGHRSIDGLVYTFYVTVYGPHRLKDVCAVFKNNHRDILYVSNLEMTHVRACVLLAGPSACHCVWYIVQDEEDHAALYRPLYE